MAAISNAELVSHWPTVRAVFREAFGSSFHYAIASVGEDGAPHITPIASLMLHPEKPEGVYFEIFTTQLAKNVQANPKVCVLAVNSHKRFWLRSFFNGKFSEPPAVRLYGTVGERVPATEEEVRRWQKRTRLLQGMKGYALLWRHLSFVRHIQFTGAQMVHLGQMTER